MKSVITVLLLGLLSHAESALELLKESDKGRGGIDEGLVWDITIQNTENGATRSRDFQVKAKGSDAHVEATAPARSKGEVFIFNDRNMWFYKPSVKKPVMISARQKLMGQAMNGDIASINYARDYDAEIEKNEEINKEKYFVLMLKAKADNLTYDKIRYWVSAKTKLATKIEFLTIQGKVFKVGELKYENKVNFYKKSIPFVSQLKIVDAKYPKNFSIITYKRPERENFPKSLFNVNNLSR